MSPVVENTALCFRDGQMRRTKEHFVLESASERHSFPALSSLTEGLRGLASPLPPVLGAIHSLLPPPARCPPAGWRRWSSPFSFCKESHVKPAWMSLELFPPSSLGSAGLPLASLAFLSMEVQVLNIRQFRSLPLLPTGPRLHLCSEPR